MNQLSDEQLLSELSSTDKTKRNEALKQLYAQQYPIIADFITNNSGNDDEAADIFQDAIIVFYEKIRLDQLELNCTIRTYIYSVCRNLWLNRLRSQKRLTNIDDQIMTIPIPSESLEVIESNERNNLIMRLLEKVGADCKKVLTHYYFERLKMVEIAVRMDFANEQVAKNKKSKCMKKLKQLVQESPGIKNILK